jgi:hypothetical protein
MGHSGNIKDMTLSGATSSSHQPNLHQGKQKNWFLYPETPKGATTWSSLTANPSRNILILRWQMLNYSITQMCFMESPVWRADYEMPMRTGHKKGEMQLNCFYLKGKISIVLATKQKKAELLNLQEGRFPLLQCHTPPREPLLYPVCHCL